MTADSLSPAIFALDSAATRLRRLDADTQVLQYTAASTTGRA